MWSDNSSRGESKLLSELVLIKRSLTGIISSKLNHHEMKHFSGRVLDLLKTSGCLWTAGMKTSPNLRTGLDVQLLVTSINQAAPQHVHREGWWIANMSENIVFSQFYSRSERNHSTSRRSSGVIYSYCLVGLAQGLYLSSVLILDIHWTPSINCNFGENRTVIWLLELSRQRQ